MRSILKQLALIIGLWTTWLLITKYLGRTVSGLIFFSHCIALIILAIKIYRTQLVSKRSAAFFCSAYIIWSISDALWSTNYFLNNFSIYCFSSIFLSLLCALSFILSILGILFSSTNNSPKKFLLSKVTPISLIIGTVLISSLVLFPYSLSMRNNYISFYSFGEIVPILCGLLFIICSLQVLLSSSSTNSAVYASGTLAWVLGDCAIRVIKILDSQINVDIYSVLCSVGIYISISPFFHKEILSLNEPINLKNTVTERKFYSLVVLFGSLAVFAASGELNISSLRLFCIITSAAAFSAVFLGSQKEENERNRRIRLTAKKEILNEAKERCHNLRSFMKEGTRISRSFLLPEKDRKYMMCIMLTTLDMGERIYSQYNQIINEEEGKDQINIPTTAVHLLNLVQFIGPMKLNENPSTLPINIEFFSSTEQYSLFSQLNETELRAVLSNLLNNAIEHGRAKNISLSLKTGSLEHCIEITDDGLGIPDKILKKFGKEPVSSIEHASRNQFETRGHGVFHAYKTIESFFGRVTVNSNSQKGSKFSIFLPSIAPPLWFLERLVFKPGATVVVVDDNPETFLEWRSKFKELIDTNIISDLITFSDAQLFLEWVKKNKKNNVLFLLDYNFNLNYHTVVSICIQENIVENTVIVTNSWDDKEIQCICIENRLLILPKEFLQLIPVIVSTAPIRVYPYQKDGFCLIDDNNSFLAEFEESAKLHEIPYYGGYNSISDFLKNKQNIPKTVRIGIDSNLGNGVKGEKESFKLFSEEYRKLYLLTCYTRKDIICPMWISDVSDKTPPWEW